MQEEVRVWINGAFDVLHIGHIRLLKYGTSIGKVRVGLDGDKRLKQNKGQDRPFNSLQDRVDFISSIKYVSSVVTFNSDEELVERIKEYQPHVMVIGDDYRYRRIIGVEYIPKVIFFDKIQGKSTTAILNYEKDIDNRG
jgi:D-beta-D-heptose 7-phosphate kinase/D-beta-D-heptose 1-phosphate adenosyltransferase